MRSSAYHFMSVRLVLIALASMAFGESSALKASDKPRVIVTSDGEIDDECSMVRFLLYANDVDVEGIITSSSQYHAHGHKWAGDDWMQPYLAAYAKVYPNLVKHDPRYPTPEFLQTRGRNKGTFYFLAFLRGRRRGRSVDSKPKRVAVNFCQRSLP